MKQRRIAVVLAGSLIAVGLGAYASPTALADGGGPAVSPTKQQDAVAYWTPERMRSARQVAIKRPAGRRAPTRVQVGTERVIRAASLDSRSSRTTVGHRWTKGGKVVKTTGKIFFTIPVGEPSPGDYVCSGSVAPANNKSIIITAGHCVNDANDHQQLGDGRRGRYVTNWVFIPGYDGSSLLDPAPYGVFPATELRAPGRWVKKADFSYDVGFATVGAEIGGRHPGALVANAQGSQGLGFNLPRHRYVDNFGYPADPPFDGRLLAYSAGPALNADANGAEPGNSVRTDDPLGSNDQVVQSDLTGGSSGGPWFYHFNQAKGTGTQVSVNSFSYLDLSPKRRKKLRIPKDNIWGPYFGAAIERLFDSVQGPLPQAASQSVSTPEDKPVKITLSGTKSVPDDPQPLRFTIITPPAHGELTRHHADVSYTPDPNFNGHDAFRFVAGNGINKSAPATVRVNVTPVNDPPTVAPLDARTRWNQPVDITLKGHDPDSSKLTYALADPPGDGGKVMITGDVATYTPAEATGRSTADTVTFGYLASDGKA
ncbi:MAG: hypothetical protein J2P23_06775, partial [Microlunatus sp.]|nr:hypothetical protein [Microlunatus sp.]